MSGGALMSQLHLNSSACCLNSLPLNLKHRIFPEFLHLTNHTEKFTLSTKKSPRNCRRTVCFAVEDLKENDQFSGSVGISSPFEDTQGNDFAPLFFVLLPLISMILDYTF